MYRRQHPLCQPPPRRARTQRNLRRNKRRNPVKQRRVEKRHNAKSVKKSKIKRPSGRRCQMCNACRPTRVAEWSSRTE
jgi:hypothetical protein